MVRRVGIVGRPRDYLLARGTWPAGPFRANTPIAIRYAAAIAANLTAALADSDVSRSAVCRAADIHRQTLYDILTGEGISDIRVIANLEQALNVRLWPNNPTDVTTG